MGWSLLLLVAACAQPQVNDIAFPAVTIDADSSVRGSMDAASLTTTNRQAIETYVDRRVIDANGREYLIEQVREIDPPGILSDFAGTKHFRIELTMKRGRRMEPPEAVKLIADTIRANPGYLDLTEQGGSAVADEIAAQRSIADVARLLTTKYEPRRVTAESVERENRRVEEAARRGD